MVTGETNSYTVVLYDVFVYISACTNIFFSFQNRFFPRRTLIRTVYA